MFLSYPIPRIRSLVFVVAAVCYSGFAARGQLNAADISFHDYKGGGWIELSGEITAGDAAEIEAALKYKAWRNAALYLDSPGGSAIEGILLGLLARTKGITTVVGNRSCASACALAWAGGEIRLMMPNARVGFHSVYRIQADGQPKRSEIGNKAVKEYVELLSLPDAAYHLMTQANPEEMLWISPSIASNSGLEYHQLDPERDVVPFSQQ